MRVVAIDLKNASVVEVSSVRFGALHALLQIGRYAMVTDSTSAMGIHPDGSNESIADLVALIRAEYDDMPSLALTCPQLCRLFAIDPGTCDKVARILVDSGVLVRGANGSYTRRGRVM